MVPPDTQPDQDERLSAIFEIATALATEQRIDSLLPRFLLRLTATLHAAETGVILLYDTASERLIPVTALGYKLSPLKRLRLAAGEAMSGRALQSGQPGIYASAESIRAVRGGMTRENLRLFDQATKGMGEPMSAVCVPLIAAETTVGALVLENRSSTGAFHPDDLPFLVALAELVALAIENARLREELQAVQTMEEANRLKAELISTLAHEMRTPLTSIKGYSTALLMDDVSFSPEAQGEFLRIIDEECDVLEEITHDLLESSIIDAGLLRLEPQPVMLPRLVKHLVDDVSRRSPNHKLLVDFPPGFPIIDADANRISQVLRNLLDNAVKYSPEGGLVIVRGEVSGDEVRVAVADQGIGIAPEYLNRLFERFFRVRSGLGDRVVGSGLGLPIARTIVESHGGQIWAESQVDEGTTLYVTLPTKAIERSPRSEELIADE